jgi:hypothetical protein
VIAAIVRGVGRRPQIVFGAAALFLVPWIVVLALTQQARGAADHVEALRLTFVAVVVVLGIALLVRSATAPVAACMVGGAITGFAGAAVWFDLVTRIDLPTTRIVTRLGAYTALAGACSTLVGLLCLYRSRERHSLARLALVVALVVLVLEATSVVTNRTTLLPVDNLDVAWVGLDVGELIGLTTLAVALATTRRIVVFVGPATAALLFSDATINVLTAGGALSVLAALGMAVIEVGLGCLAVAVAVREARRLEHGSADLGDTRVPT